MSTGRWLEGSSDPRDIELRRALDEAANVRLDDVTSRRLWATVAEPEELRAVPRRHKVRWWWFMGGVGAAAAAALLLVTGTGAFNRSRDPHVAVPTSGNSAGTAQQQGGAEQGGLAVSSLLVGPAEVRTGPEQSLRVRLARSGEAGLGPSSRLTVDHTATPTLAEGEARFAVQPQPPGQRFAVVAGAYRIVVVGTRFHVSVKGEKVGVLVEEGRVEVWRAERLLAQLGHGDVWSSSSALGPSSSGAQAGPTLPAESGRHRAASRTEAVAGAPRPEPPAEAPAPVVAAPADLAGEARAALAAGDARRALEIYRALERNGGPVSENALYEQGRILREKLGAPREAISAWRRYLQAHPAGLLRSEAKLSVIDTLVGLGDADAALAEARSFLSHFPDSERRAEVARVAGDIYRAKGDCRAAIDVYRTALQAPRPRSVADHVTFHRAACLLAIGDSSGRDAVRDYLERFPSGHYRDDAGRLLRSVSGAGATAPRR